MLRNPVTNAIPSAIRSREVQHADQVYRETRHILQKRRMEINWFEVGPFDVGGRTRALAVDLENTSRLIAGGVSGGLWESVDRGATWRPLKLDANNLSVTYIVQDPRPTQRNVWYFASGEFSGNSASDAARIAPYFGSGMYKSTDGGNTWFLLSAGNAGDELAFDSPFDFVNRIAISPTTGSVFLAANAVGIYRSQNGGNTFGPIPSEQRFPDPVLGGINDHFWSDVAVNEEGLVLATLSSSGSNDDPILEPGVYLSRDDGDTWQNITPATFPNTHGRSIVAFAPSNQQIAYVFSTTLGEVNGREDVRLHRINIATGDAENLSGNLAQLSEAGNIETQNGYNMALAVKPDDEDFVLLGGTNVYRSRNAFASSIVERLDYWIGGYDAVDDDFGSYENHHPDQHLFVFAPDDPNRLWTANDGGIYMTNNISRQNEVVWFDMNQRYVTTQFYTVAIPSIALDPRIAGGTQDNGTPYLRLDDLTQTSRNISVGDGTHLYFGANFVYTGFQNGSILRLQYNDELNPTFAGFSFVQPEAANNQIFVTPFVVDPNDEQVMYYPAGSVLWRNDQLEAISSGQTDPEGTDQGWSRVTNIPQMGARVITAMTASQSPAHILYYGASDARIENAQPPEIYRLPNANTDNGSSAVDISIPGLVGGLYIADIAVHPSNADEILVVLSNYEEIGLYHSTDGGQSYTAVEGNLADTDQAPGPSLRAATILLDNDNPMYFVGTSTGVYTTAALNGTGTVWVPEAVETIGQAVVWDITSRAADRVIAVGTHGRGLFVGSLDDDFNPRPLPESYALSQNYPNPFASITRIGYNLPERSRVSLEVFDLSGKRIATLTTNREQETGRHEVVFNAASVTSGVYLFHLTATPLSGSGNRSTFSAAKKMMVIK